MDRRHNGVPIGSVGSEVVMFSIRPGVWISILGLLAIVSPLQATTANLIDCNQLTCTVSKCTWECTGTVSSSLPGCGALWKKDGSTVRQHSATTCPLSTSFVFTCLNPGPELTDIVIELIGIDECDANSSTSISSCDGALAIDTYVIDHCILGE
jgi:hypothetical protein